MLTSGLGGIGECRTVAIDGDGLRFWHGGDTKLGFAHVESKEGVWGWRGLLHAKKGMHLRSTCASPSRSNPRPEPPIGGSGNGRGWLHCARRGKSGHSPKTERAGKKPD